MGKHPITPKRCGLEHQGSLIRARNNTTRFTYFWCPIDRFVHKDVDMDGRIG